MSNATLNDVFNLDPDTVIIEADTLPRAIRAELVPQAEMLPALPPAIVEDPNDTIAALNHDVNYARMVMTENIDLVREAAKSAISLAESGDSPRAYEVVASMLTAIINANKELVNLHRTKEDTTAATRARLNATNPSIGGSGGVTIEKAVFVGRAADLLRELRNLSKKDE